MFLFLRVLFFRIILLTALIHPLVTHAQDTTQTALRQALKTVNAFTARSAFEKAYIHTDKPSYILGDTLWLKGYLLNASYFTASQKRGILYVEIASHSNKVISRISLPVLGGLSYGQIPLDEKEFKQGGYILRAYTNWMRNAGSDAVFEKPFYIVKAQEKDWVVNYRSSISNENDKDKLRLGLKLSELNRAPVGLRELQVRLYDDKRIWGQAGVQTGADGSLQLDMDVAEKLNGKTATLSIEDKRKGGGNRILSMPLPINRPEKMDLQFMPEGGELVAGLPSRVAFKAIHEDGLGTRVSGKVYNSRQEEVGSFESAHKGMGSFFFTPRAGESYSASVSLGRGEQLSYQLPAVKASGTTLSIDNPLRADSCEVTINASSDVKEQGRTLLLFAHARGVPVYAVSFKSSALPKKIKVAKGLFPSGVARFTLASRELAALNERIVFIDHEDNLVIETTLHKPDYTLRDSVALQVKVTDEAGLPVKGNFSISVTDDSQVKTDSLLDYSIINQLLLASDVKGRIEEPGYYENPSRSVAVWQHLDNLLLTQGWTGFAWEDAFKPETAPQYQAEAEFEVKGRVLNALNKPVSGAPLTLLASKPALFMESVSDQNGRFAFSKIFPADTAAFHIQAKNRNNKSFNVGIEVDEFVPLVLRPFPSRIQPWYANIDTASMKRLDKRLNLESVYNKAKGKVLQEVVIKAKKIVKGSNNLNGPGEADHVLNREDVVKAGRKSLFDLLEQNIPGFGGVGGIYYINDQTVHLVIDGICTTPASLADSGRYLPPKHYMDYYDADEILGLEVMTSMSASYISRYLPDAIPRENAFIEVTTIGGKGPYIHKMIGTYVYRPIPFTTPKKFYSPRYSTASVPDMTDIRSTIYWKPDVLTNSKGLATISFFTADTPGTYSVIIEGSDIDGAVGMTRRKISIRPSGFDR